MRGMQGTMKHVGTFRWFCCFLSVGRAYADAHCFIGVNAVFADKNGGNASVQVASYPKDAGTSTSAGKEQFSRGIFFTGRLGMRELRYG